MCVLALPDGYRARGLSFDVMATQPTLHALAGRRAQQSVVFSSPRAEQQMILCSFGEADLKQAQAKQAARPQEQAPQLQQQSSAPPLPPPPEKKEAAPASVAAVPPPPQPSQDGLGAVFGALQTHLDGKFAAIDAAIARLDARLGAVESQQTLFMKKASFIAAVEKVSEKA